jgi:hypothetical protein
MTKPLWRQFYEMTPEECEAEKAEDLRRMRSGEMTEDEALERAQAWRLAGDAKGKEADELERLGRLANASGCPKGAPVIPWLIEKGILVKTDGRYLLTKQPGPARG